MLMPILFSTSMQGRTDHNTLYGQQAPMILTKAPQTTSKTKCRRSDLFMASL